VEAGPGVAEQLTESGALVVEQGEVRSVPYGPVWCAEPAYDEGVLPDVRSWFEESYSISFDNYPVDDEYLVHGIRTLTG
jgi:formylmethanofuran dehydrogenase subunit A